MIRKQIKKRLMWSLSDTGPGRPLPPSQPPVSAPSQSRVPALYAVSILTCLLTAIFVGTRFYVNVRFKLPLGRDFWTIFAAGFFCWTAGGIGIWGGTLGLGKHSADIPKSNHLELRNCSILFFYLKRLSMSSYHRVTTFLICAISALFCLVRVVGNTYQCLPNPEIRVGMCLKLQRMWYALGIIAMALDLAIWSLPIPSLLKSARKMPQGVRVGVLATLGVGLLACIMTVARIVAIKALTKNMEDMWWNASLVFIFEQLEVGLGIAAATENWRGYTFWASGSPRFGHRRAWGVGF
ncbi:hypothetical protein EV426DRAFT_275790 [Tirmania nivea]|nr:hypothetical protein EV426DRAFT_275790 [Tirmania nivea]